jgi:hypothetical protein
MSFENLIGLAFISVLVIVGGYWIATHYFSEEARWERRRRRSNSPVIRKGNRPSVKLSVRTKKDRRK